MRPRVFVGSSVESIDVAAAVQELLEFKADVTVWSQDVFDLTRSSLDSLLDELCNFDFGIFVFGPDDEVRSRGGTFDTVRDNVLLEMGLFLGRLGSGRTFFLTPRGSATLRIPSDLVGITPATYSLERTDGNLLASLGPACNKILRAIQKAGAAPRERAIAAGSVFLDGGRPPLSRTIDLIMAAEKKVVVLGVSLRSFAGYFDQRPTHEFKDRIIAQLSAGIDFTLALLDPECTSAAAYAEDRKDVNLIRQILLSQSLLQGIVGELRLKSLPGKMEILAFDHLPFGYALLVDPDSDGTGKAFVCHYLYDRIRADCPHLEIHERATPRTFASYRDAVARLLKDARRVDSTDRDG